MQNAAFLVSQTKQVEIGIGLFSYKVVSDSLAKDWPTLNG